MQDRFRFRAWNEQERRMIYGVLVDLRCGHPLIPEEMDFQKDTYTAKLLTDVDLREAPELLMQCTGLKDNIGDLIYEGDILEVVEDGALWLVTWVERYAQFLLHRYVDGKLDDSPTGYGIKPVADEGKIIGNYHENPELLKEKK